MLLLTGRPGLREASHVTLTSAMMLRLLLLLESKPGLSRLLLLTHRRKLLLLQQQMRCRRGSKEGNTGVGEGLRELSSLSEWRRPSVRILIHNVYAY